MTEIEKLRAKLKVHEEKISFLEELEQTKSPAEKAYKAWWGDYPLTNWRCEVIRWETFQAGYNAACEEKVSEWNETGDGV